MTFDSHGRQTADKSDNQLDSATLADNADEMTPEKLISSFPAIKLRSLNQKISNPRWVVPVLPEQELEHLLNAAITLTLAGCDHNCEPCLDFYKNALTTSFIKILTDEAVNSWKYNIHHCILMTCGKLLHLIAIHMHRDNPYLLDLLSIVLDPNNKFNTFNVARQPECFGPEGVWGILEDNKQFAATPSEPKRPRGWLVDLINRFGQLGGFDNLLERFHTGVASVKSKPSSPESVNSVNKSVFLSRDSVTTADGSASISLSLIYYLIRPFGQCYELLTPATIEKYFMPIWIIVLDILDSLTDAELKYEAKSEGRSDLIHRIIKSARCLASRLPDQSDLLRDIEVFRLKMILRLLQVSSFNGKMNALNEINKVITAVSYCSHRTQISQGLSDDEMNWLTAERMAVWIKNSNVLDIVLKDSLHQPQYVEKLEKIIRFLIKENTLTLDDLDAVWKAQAGKHEAIVKNVHDLLAKLAWDFLPQQLDHLFNCFQTSMTTANKRQREHLLELIRRLAEDDKNGVMAQKVLNLFWTLAHNVEIPPEVLDQALIAHVKILDYSCSQERDAQKTVWLDKCVDELKSGDAWVLPALRLIREICCLYESNPHHVQSSNKVVNRQQVIERLQNEYSLVILVTNSLISYMDKIRALATENPNLEPNKYCIDGRFSHELQIQERLDFLKYLLKDGQLWLCADQAKQIWHCLAVKSVFPSDREECFRWFSKLMGEEPDLDPGVNKDFFENNILQLDASLLTESGIKCFERFFKAVNSKEEKLKAIHGGYILENNDLIGKEYLWHVITTADAEIATKGIELLKEVSTALGPTLLANVASFHEAFIGECCDKLKALYDSIIFTNNVGEYNNDDKDMKFRCKEAEKICRVLKVLQEYIKECDRSFTGERYKLPLCRATRGKHTSLYIRFQNPGRSIDDMEIITHSNETIASFKRTILKRLKGTSSANIKIEFFYNNGELIEISDEIDPLSSYAIRDKMVLTAKLTPMGTVLASSPDSSSDSSTGSPPRPSADIRRVESEFTLPGVMISENPLYTKFFLKLHQLGVDTQYENLKDNALMLLNLLPADRETVEELKSMCHIKPTNINALPETIQNNEKPQQPDQEHTTPSMEKQTPLKIFLYTTPANVLYNLEVLNAILVPAIDPLSEESLIVQSAWLRSGVAHFLLELLTKNNFLPNADMPTKRSAFQSIMRLIKLFLYVLCCVLSRVGNEPVPSNCNIRTRSQIDILKQILTSIPNNSENTLRFISTKLGENIAAEMLTASNEGQKSRKLFSDALHWSCPDIAAVKAIIQLAWSSSCGRFQMYGSKDNFSSDISMPGAQDLALYKEALEVLILSLVLNPSANEILIQDEFWSEFITSLVLKNPSRIVRQIAAEQLFFTCTYYSGNSRPFEYMISHLISLLHTIPSNSGTCADLFQLLCRTLNYGCTWNWSHSVIEGLLAHEINWLRQIKNNVISSGNTQVHEDLLEGHLCLTKELMFFIDSKVKTQLSGLLEELADDFLFPASREYLHFRQTGKLNNYVAPPPVCKSPHTIAAASDLLVALCQNSVSNMKLLTKTLINYVCNEIEPLKEWDYLPPIGTRPLKGFCGLKNAGATCYMNSVLQQLYMVPSIRVGILKAEGAAVNESEDFSGDADSTLFNDDILFGNAQKSYHVGILKHVQAIFAHLGHSALQYYVPRGLWTHFKLQGEPVNLREQQDAVEFFMSLFESLDEGLKALGHSQLMANTLGGSFSDQKICQECPHRYSKEEPFSVFSVDIRNHSSLTESLEQYVKGELLEGADAYHCDKCNKKVVTIKRLCVRKLPPVLAIQLKRFEYDYERVCAIKFNDYFEFPRILDMEPYTVFGLAKLDGEVVEFVDNSYDQTEITKYELTGIIVHSGQASGGHYFSYILYKDPVTNKGQWYKFDDNEVTECKMNEDEEMKVQCFGGEYMGEIYDNNLKRIQYRRQKRWWNAYMLFYTRCDHKPAEVNQSVEQLSLAESSNFVLPMPKAIEISVRIQNIRFLHSKSIFSVEFFTFIKNLVGASVPPLKQEKPTLATEELSLLGVQLASHFLFHSGFRTKKTLRGPVIEWYDTLSLHLRFSATVRKWFASNALLNPPGRLAEYILIAPSPEVRTVFVKLVVLFCHFAVNDEPLPNIEGGSLSEQILICVLKLLKGEVADYGKHLPHYFSLFNMYAGLGKKEKLHLLKLNVPTLFMQAALDEGPVPQIKYQYPELNKLHQVVSHLIRCSDISDKCQSSNQSVKPMPNVYKDPSFSFEELIPLSPEASELLFVRTGYIKKLIEDTNVGEEGLKLIQYCCWENPHFSRCILTELLWQCGFAYCQDMRHHTDLLLNVLLIEDTWQNHRIHNALMGIAEERGGLLETILKTKTHYQKRAYQIIKCLTQLFHKSQIALAMLNSNQHIAKHWVMAVEWLQEELDKQRGIGCQYNYSWSPPAQSNDSTNGYMLERSQSAKNTWSLAYELCQEEEQEETNESDSEVKNDDSIAMTFVLENTADNSDMITTSTFSAKEQPPNPNLSSQKPQPNVAPTEETPETTNSVNVSENISTSPEQNLNSVYANLNELRLSPKAVKQQGGNVATKQPLFQTSSEHTPCLPLNMSAPISLNLNNTTTICKENNDNKEGI